MKISEAYPKLFSDLNHQNQVLKILTFVLVLAQALSTAVILILANQGPKIVALNQIGDFQEYSDHLDSKQLEGGVKKYLDLRYKWKRENILKQAKSLEGMIAGPSISAFRKTIEDLNKFTKDKNIQSRIYPRSIEVNDKTQTAVILSDRITEIDGLKAASNFRVVLKYEIGDRTDFNPWGFYVEKESEAVE